MLVKHIVTFACLFTLCAEHKFIGANSKSGIKRNHCDFVTDIDLVLAQNHSDPRVVLTKTEIKI